jgi:hypothetical protein
MHMRPLPATLALVLTASLAPAAAGSAQEKDETGTVHINAVKDPELRAYRAIAAGLDVFDAQHALAPAVPQLRFQVEGRAGKKLEGELPLARIAADDFSIPLSLDGQGRFSIPRSQAAWDARAELVLNRRKSEVRVETWVRTPDLADNQYRMGDIRLDCRVKVAIGKAEAPFWAVGLVNSVLLTTDWCAWFKGATPKGGDRNWPHRAGAKLAGATLHDGERSLALKVSGKSFRVPIGDTGWSNDALIEVTYAPAEDAAVPADTTATRTAAETPKTAP